MKQFLIAGALCFGLWTIADAIDINGKVRSTTEKYATVVSDSDLVPKPGDKVNIFFKLAGSSAEVSVAAGHVYEITGEDIMVEIDNATGTVTKDQLARIVSPDPLKRSKAENPSSTQVRDQLAAVTINFNDLAAGPISNDAFADRGLHLRKGKGSPGIYPGEPNMAIPFPYRNVLLLADERVTSLTIVFDNPVKRFALVRVGATGGASIPTWTMKAYNDNGKLIGSVGEKHGLPSAAKPFAVEGTGIARVEITTDNRNGSGTWATWSSLPIAAFGFDR
jgi:hypothetical protein